MATSSKEKIKRKTARASQIKSQHVPPTLRCPLVQRHDRPQKNRNEGSVYAPQGCAGPRQAHPIINQTLPLPDPSLVGIPCLLAAQGAAEVHRSWDQVAGAVSRWGFCTRCTPSLCLLSGWFYWPMPHRAMPHQVMQIGCPSCRHSHRLAAHSLPHVLPQVWKGVVLENVLLRDKMMSKSTYCVLKIYCIYTQYLLHCHPHIAFNSLPRYPSHLSSAPTWTLGSCP